MPVPDLVTIAIPVYRRLGYLAGVLHSVASQDYAQIDVLVSDNGTNGPELREIVEKHLNRPYRFRLNPESVDITRHYNQLVEEARGEYFVLLADDDEISPQFVSALVRVLRQDPQIGVALPRLEIMDEEGSPVSRERGPLPPCRMTGAELVSIWCRNEYDFVCFCTTLARTQEIRRAGAYPLFPKGTAVDDALLLRLSLGRKVAFEPEAVFRYRVYQSSHGLGLPYRELAADLRAFLRFLDTDPILREFATREPGTWKALRHLLRQLTWRTYRFRWKHLYRNRLSRAEWVRAAFALPFIPAYYASVLRHLTRRSAGRLKRAISQGAGTQAT